MKRIILYAIFLLFISSNVHAGLKSYAFPFIGKWQPAEDPLLIEEYGFQDIQNLRKDGKRLRGVSGHTKINTNPFFANYHYTDFTETDASARLTVADYTITVANLDVDEDAYVYLDKGANYFNEDVEFQCEVNCTDTSLGKSGIWALTNNVDGLYTLADSDLDHLALYSEAYPDTYTKLLLDGDGTDASTTFIDHSQSVHTVTANGDAQVDTAQKKFGTGSILFDGTGDYLSIPNSTDWQFGSAAFTIDFWVRFNTLPSSGQNKFFYYYYEDADNYFTFYISNVASNYGLRLYSNEAGVNTIYVSAPWITPIINTWYHIAFIRGWGQNANQWAITVDGTQIGTTTTDADSCPALAAGVLYLGDSTGNLTIDGWMDEFRISKGIARWTTNFTVPSTIYSTVCSLTLQETNGAADTTDQSSELSTDTDYYLKVTRDESEGTYGKLYCYIYSDSVRLTLVDTLTVTLTEKQDFRYQFGSISHDGTTGGKAWSGTISNLGEYYNIPINGFHFIKDQPSESYFLIQSQNVAGDSVVIQNTTAIPSQGNFSTTAFHTDSSSAGVGRFSTAPNGNMIYCNGDESLIWAGNEKKIDSIFVCSGAGNNNPQDYTREVQNTRQDAGNFLSIGEPIDTYTVLLLHCEGTDASTTFTDSSDSPHVVTANGDAQIDTDHDKFGTASGIFDGTGDYLSIPDHADWFMSTGEFTIDFWTRFNSIASDIGFFYQRVDADNQVIMYWDQSASTLLFRVYSGGSNTVDLNYTWNPSINRWYHLAVIRGWGGNANSWALTVNGTALTTVTDSDAWPDLAASFAIGRINAPYLNGWIDEFRVSKGVARWTSNFTVPVNAYGSDRLYWVIGSTRPLQGVKYYILNANTETSTLTANEWTGSAWSSLSVTDGTASGGISLAQTGSVTFNSTVNTSRPTVISGEYLFWYQFNLSAGTTDIYYITVDAPVQNIIDIWDATPIGSLQFQVYDGGQWEDYSEEVTVETTVDYETNPMAAELDDLTNTEYIYIAFPERIAGIKFNMTSHLNTNAATVTVYYWDGSSWISVGTVTDDTAEGGVSLAKSGYMHWNPPEKGEEFPRNLFGLHSSWVTKKIITTQEQIGRSPTSPLPLMVVPVQPLPKAKTITTRHAKTTEVPPGYYYKIMWSATLSADVLIDTVSGIRAQELNAIPGYKFPFMFQGRSFLCSETSGEKNKCIYSMFEAPDVWNGADTGALYFGDDTEITANALLYNTYKSSSFDQVIITKRNETFRLVGDGPDNWIINQLSSNIGCPAPLSMQICEVGTLADQELRNIAIWQSDSGVVMCDGAAIVDISKDIQCYWDPHDSRYIPSDRIDDSEATYDPELQIYKLLISSGSGQTSHNVELEYSLKYNEWTKIYRENTSGANPLQCSFQVHDTDGNTYIYGASNEGYVYRLENGTDWDGTDITQYIWTKDILLDDNRPMFNQTIVELFRLMFETKTTTDQDMTITHYCDGTATTDGINNQVVPDDIDMDDGPYDSQDCMLGRCLRHSFKISTDISDITDGMELTGMGLLYESFDIIED